MNPFALPGPQFLLFYAALTIVVLLLLIVALRRSGDLPLPLDLADPYEVACLRGGPNLMLRLAMYALLERGTLTMQGVSVVANPNGPAPQHPLEAAIAQAFGSGAGLTSVFEKEQVKQAARVYQDRLREVGATISEDRQSLEWKLRWLAVLVLVVVAIPEVPAGLAAGRHNIWFPVLLLAVVGSAFALLYKLHLRTARGTALLNELRARVRPPQPDTTESGTNEVAGRNALLAIAVLGAAGLPPGPRSDAAKLFPN